MLLAVKQKEIWELCLRERGKWLLLNFFHYPKAALESRFGQ